MSDPTDIRDRAYLKARALVGGDAAELLWEAAKEIDRLRATIAGYENGISWNTAKLSDAERLDAHAEGYFSRQKEVDDLKETIRRLENDCYKKCGVCEFDYGRAAPPIARSGESG